MAQSPKIPLDLQQKIFYLVSQFSELCMDIIDRISMPLHEEEPKYAAKHLFIVGMPLFILAVALSLVVHQFSHILVAKAGCGQTSMSTVIKTFSLDDPHSSCPLASFAGITTTFILAVVSFAAYIRAPQNLFLGAMAFVNASARLPETITVFLQLLFHQSKRAVVDESIALGLLRMHDSTAATVILCFFSFTIFFLTIIIVHDTKVVPRKWLVAFGLFLAIIPLEHFLWSFLAPILS
jgi:hypothetical protein